MANELRQCEWYPDGAEVDAWMEGVWQSARGMECRAEMLGEQGFTAGMGVRHMKGFQYVCFSPQGMDPFYAYWQPAPAGPAPLLVHTPGYGAEISVHPDLVMQGYNVLHVNPLGYMTPAGPDEAKLRDGTWPVFPDTYLSGAERGYRHWLMNCAMAVRWAQGRDEVIADRVSFFGTSQGGGGSLLLGSLYQGRGARSVAADEPFLVDFPLCVAEGRSEWGAELRSRIAKMGNLSGAWWALGMIDALSHAHRLTLPVMLTAGSDDATCPAASIESLFESLPDTKLYCHLKGQGHGYTQEFIALSSAWFRLYA